MLSLGATRPNGNLTITVALANMKLTFEWMNMSLAVIQAIAPNSPGIWGYQGVCSADDVRRDVPVLLSKLAAGQTLHVLTGVHGYCGNLSGGLAGRDASFAIEDFKAMSGLQGVALHQAPSIKPEIADKKDAIAAANKDLNDMIRQLQSAHPGVFLLAYCCSAGAPPIS
jgi:hypothetical protein